jgi:hypothetical protein
MGKRTRIVTAIILIALGGLWILQGGGWLQGSFMSGDRTWLVIGIALAAAGLGMLLQMRQRGRR